MGFVWERPVFSAIKHFCKRVSLQMSESKRVVPVCQVGHPVLRKETVPVPIEAFATAEFKQNVEKLINTMRYHKGFGMSAPQIGLNWQIFAVEVTDHHMKKFSKEFIERRNVQPFPLEVFVNPSIKIIDDTQIVVDEGCASVLGFYAMVPRAKEIEITAMNTRGDLITMTAKDWTARIIQHEYDHLHRTLFVDRMITTTFSSVVWNVPKKVKNRPL